MNFLNFSAMNFDSLGSQHMIWVAPTTAQPKQPLATWLQLLANAILVKKLAISKNFINFQLFL